jgi:uncharacterized protein (DUF488 family)
MKIHTIGYGGRATQDFLELLKAHGIATVVDVRLRPDRSSMGTYAKAKTPDKGIEHLLASAGIHYVWMQELGNVFVGMNDWSQRYQRLMDQAGDLLVDRLLHLPDPQPFCLMCAEKHAEECHRKVIADHLVNYGHEVTHIK